MVCEGAVCPVAFRVAHQDERQHISDDTRCNRVLAVEKNLGANEFSGKVFR